jgi:hypothetical protein
MIMGIHARMLGDSGLSTIAFFYGKGTSNGTSKNLSLCLFAPPIISCQSGVLIVVYFYCS